MPCTEVCGDAAVLAECQVTVIVDTIFTDGAGTRIGDERIVTVRGQPTRRSLTRGDRLRDRCKLSLLPDAVRGHGIRPALGDQQMVLVIEGETKRGGIV